ncbi:MAG: hypothetical protein ACJAZF_002808 [Granulosicoccus sp.]|jgi:hypothetical protein
MNQRMSTSRIQQLLATTLASTSLFFSGIIISQPLHATTGFSYSYIDTYDEMCGADDADEGCAEISAYEHTSGRVFTTNGVGNALRVLELGPRGSLIDVGSIDLSNYGAAPNSVAASGSIVAVAMEAEIKQDNGVVAFFDVRTLAAMGTVSAGALPDMLIFTPDGKYLLVANEGEPDAQYLVDPEGSITVIDTQTMTAVTADFLDFATLTDASVRIFGPGATVAQDLEPEYITVSADSTTAWISLQENNALAILDIPTATITAVKGLGFKDHSVSGNGFDASDRDGGDTCRLNLENEAQCINTQIHPTLGMYQPDAISSYTVNGNTYIVTANEGDARDYDGYSEETRVGDDVYPLDAAAFSDSEELKDTANLGRLKTTLANGDTDGDGDFDVIYSFGARSFSIWNSNVELVFDSGSDFEVRLATLQQQGTDVWTDSRSDDKGPEPESVAIGTLGDRTVAFIGLERVSGVFVYDITDPVAPTYLGYVDSKRAGDVSPEGLIFVPTDSQSGVLVVTNELSNTTSTYRVALGGDDMVNPPQGAMPTVAGNRISWNSPDYYQVQTVDTYAVICEGAKLFQCEVSNGQYNVINLTTGDRYEDIVVGGSNTPSVNGNVISWMSMGYYQVQNTADYASVCEGGGIQSCEVTPGTYHLINHTTGERFEDIVVR